RSLDPRVFLALAIELQSEHIRRQARLLKSARLIDPARGKDFASMSELDSTESEIERDTGARAKHFLWRQAPYLIALILALSGVAYSNLSRQPLAGYWEFLAVAIGIVCIVTQWEYFPDNSARFQLVWTQALHWGAVLVAMNIIVLSRVQSMFPAP